MIDSRVLAVVALALTLSIPGVGEAVGQQPSPPAGSDGRAADPGTELRVWLVTAGPGDAVWERYGHNAIRVLNTRTGRDVSYNWGIFDFQQVDFIPRFLQGRMLYMMAPFSTPAMLDAYARANREIVLQELDLTPAEKLELERLAEINALPENRDYTYQYFLDNCSTRVRDLLNVVLDGRLEQQFGTRPTGTSFRHHTRRLTQVDPLIYTGMDLALGTPADQPINVWEEMFLPLTLRDQLRDVVVTRADGSSRPLLASEELAVPSDRRAEPANPPRWFVVYLTIGLFLGLVFAAAGTERVRHAPLARRTIAGLAVVWAALGGVLGTILVLLLFTDHTFAYWNENLFLVNPLLFAVAVLVPAAAVRPRWLGALRRTTSLVAGIAMFGLLCQLLPMSTQQNAMFFALLLPGHLGMAWATHRNGSAPPHRT